MTPATDMTATSSAPPLRVAIFDDVVAARGERFHIPGLEVEVFAHADDAARQCVDQGFDVVFMDYALGPGRTERRRRQGPQTEHGGLRREALLIVGGLAPPHVHAQPA